MCKEMKKINKKKMLAKKLHTKSLNEIPYVLHNIIINIIIIVIVVVGT